MDNPEKLAILEAQEKDKDKQRMNTTTQHNITQNIKQTSNMDPTKGWV